MKRTVNSSSITSISSRRNRTATQTILYCRMTLDMNDSVRKVSIISYVGSDSERECCQLSDQSCQELKRAASQLAKAYSIEKGLNRAEPA